MTLLFLALILTPSLAAEATSTACGDISTAKTLTLTANVSSTGTCFNVLSENVTIDCGGYWINYSTGGNTNTAGVWISSQDNTTITNCNINEGNASNANKYGIYLTTTKDQIIQNNNITTIGSTSHGIYSLNAEPKNITNNIINTTGTDASTIYINSYSLGETNPFITDNTLYVGNNALNGIFFESFAIQLNVTIDNNIINHSDTTNGIYIATSSDYNTISNNRITHTSGSSGEPAGIMIYYADNNNFTNNTISSSYASAYGIQIGEESTDNTFTSGTISAGGYDIYFKPNQNNTAINLTFDKSDIGFYGAGNGKIDIKYYLDVNVTDQIFRPLETANVWAFDNANAAQDNDASDANGLTTLTIPEFFQNQTGKYYYNNYSINISKTNYHLNSTALNLTLTNSTTLTVAMQPSVTTYCEGRYMSGAWDVSTAFACEDETIPVTGLLTLQSPTEIASNYFFEASNTVYNLNQNDVPFALTIPDLNLNTPAFYTDDMWSNPTEKQFYVVGREENHSIQFYSNNSDTSVLYYLDIDGDYGGNSSRLYADFIWGYYGEPLLGYYNESCLTANNYTFIDISGGEGSGYIDTSVDSNLIRNYNFYWNRSGNTFEIIINTSGNWLDKELTAYVGSDQFYLTFKNDSADTTGKGEINFQNITLEFTGADNGTAGFVAEEGSEFYFNNSQLTSNDSNIYWDFLIQTNEYNITNNNISNGGIAEGDWEYANALDSKTGGLIYNNNFTTCENEGYDYCLKIADTNNGLNISNNYFEGGIQIEAGSNILIEKNTFNEGSYINNAEINFTNNTFYKQVHLGNGGIGPQNSIFKNNNFLNKASNEPLKDSNLSNTKTLIYQNEFGYVKWEDKNNLTIFSNLSLGSMVYISSNLTGLRTDATVANLNTSAEINLSSLDYSLQPWLMKDGKRCDNTTLCNITSYSSGTLIANVSSFSEYIAQADPSQTNCGTLTEDLTFNNNVTTTSDCFYIETDNLVIDGAGYYIIGPSTNNQYSFKIVNANNVTIKNLKLINGNQTIKLESANQTTIQNITIKNTTTAFQMDSNSYENNFSYNIVDNATYGISIKSNTTVTNNQVLNSYMSILMTIADNSIIEYNNITNGSNGIYLMEVTNTNITSNRIINSTDLGIGLENSNNNIFNSNYIEETSIYLNSSALMENNFTNTEINNTNFAYNIYAYNTSTYFINATFDKNNISTEGDASETNLTFQYYLDVNVTNENFVPLETATTTSNSSNNKTSTNTTNSNGISILQITEFKISGTSRTYFNNQTINASKSGYIYNDSTSLNLSLTNSTSTHIILGTVASQQNNGGGGGGDEPSEEDSEESSEDSSEDSEDTEEESEEDTPPETVEEYVEEITNEDNQITSIQVTGGGGKEKNKTTIITLKDQTKVEFKKKNNKPVMDLKLGMEDVVGEFKQTPLVYIPWFVYIMGFLALTIIMNLGAIIGEYTISTLEEIESAKINLVKLFNKPIKNKKGKKIQPKEPINLKIFLSGLTYLFRVKAKIHKNKSTKIDIRGYRRELMSRIDQFEQEIKIITRNNAIKKYNAIGNLHSQIRVYLRDKDNIKIDDSLARLRRFLTKKKK